jgi:hypothetical protein
MPLSHCETRQERHWGGFYSLEIGMIRRHGVMGRRVPDHMLRFLCLFVSVSTL